MIPRKVSTVENLKTAAKALGTWFLKSFRGLVCEKKDGGWELSKGACMSWLLLWGCWEAVGAGNLEAHWLVYLFGGTMGYNGLKLADIGGAVSKLRGNS